NQQQHTPVGREATLGIVVEATKQRGGLTWRRIDRNKLAPCIGQHLFKSSWRDLLAHRNPGKLACAQRHSHRWMIVLLSLLVPTEIKIERLTQCRQFFLAGRRCK